MNESLSRIQNKIYACVPTLWEKLSIETTRSIDSAKMIEAGGCTFSPIVLIPNTPTAEICKYTVTLQIKLTARECQKEIISAGVPILRFHNLGPSLTYRYTAPLSGSILRIPTEKFCQTIGKNDRKENARRGTKQNEETAEEEKKDEGWVRLVREATRKK